MMRARIVYGTNSSGTQAVSEIIRQVLTNAGHVVSLTRAYEPGAQTFAGHDLVILGSCTWERFAGKQRLEGQLQQHMHALVQTMGKRSFPGQRFAVFGLGDSSYTDVCAAADHLERFVKGIGGKLVVPSLRIDGFFFDLNRNRDRAERWAKKIAVSR